ncbi:MAG TPA: hypothetical protein VI977_03985, partial [archaeon]|nr:hypothetical protein [archaeon]
MSFASVFWRAAKSYTGNMFGMPSPFFVSHIVTLDCNMRCNYCTFWREQKKQKPLAKEEIFDFL